MQSASVGTVSCLSFYIELSRLPLEDAQHIPARMKWSMPCPCHCCFNLALNFSSDSTFNTQ